MVRAVPVPGTSQGNQTGAEADCRPGEVATGGGFFSAGRPTNTGSGPIADSAGRPTGWGGTFNDAIEGRVVYVVCVSP